MNLSDATQILRATPGALRALLEHLDDAWTSHRPEPEAWSARDVMGHFISGELTDWVPRTKIMLEHGESRTFEPFDTEGWRPASEGKTLSALLEEFETLRAHNLAEIEALKVAEQLDARGTHPTFGPVTLGQMMATWAAHDLNHLSQITEAMAKRYRETVGPWRRFLTIMDRAEG